MDVRFLSDPSAVDLIKICVSFNFTKLSAFLTHCKELKESSASDIWLLACKLCPSMCSVKENTLEFLCLFFGGATSICLPFFLFLPSSCGHGRVWRDARTNPRAFCDSRLPAQPGSAGWDLSHNADRQAQIWRLPGVWYDAVTPSLSEQFGEEASKDQNRGTEDAEYVIVVYRMEMWAVSIWALFELMCERFSISSLCRYSSSL